VAVKSLPKEGFTKKSMQELERLSPENMKKSEKRPVIVILDDVRSMHNVGSAFRTCDAFNVEALWLCGYTPSPPHRDIHKTALGAEETINWTYFPNIEEAIAEAKRLDHKIYAVEQAHNSTSLEELKWNRKEKIAIVFGNEVKGVNDAMLAAAEKCIEIPQWGSKHSLNVSVSIGIVLWEYCR
jgi:23S rRNA (guanosine2251-2'-O)-methyltransferase